MAVMPNSGKNLPTPSFKRTRIGYYPLYSNGDDLC